MKEEQVRDLVATTTYILYELMDSPSYFNSVDKAMDVAKAFVNKFPYHTDWGTINWEESLYDFYKNYKDGTVIRPAK